MQPRRTWTAGSCGAFALLSGLLLLVPLAQAQPVSVSGVVVDELTSEPLAGVEVRIGVPGATRARVATDPLGRFSFAFDSGASRFDVLVDATDDYLPARLERVEPSERLEVELTPRVCLIEGSVIDAATKEGVPFAWLTLEGGRADLVRAQADALGHYRIPIDVWETAETVDENRLRTGLKLSLEQRAYLPQTLRNLDLQRHAYTPSPSPLDIVAEPYEGAILVEAYEASSRRPAAGMYLAYGQGPRYLGQIVTDAFGQAVVHVPAWRYEGRPMELNEPIDDAWIMHTGHQYLSVRAAGITPRAKLGALGPDEAALTPRQDLRVRFSMAPLESQTGRSSFLIGAPGDRGPGPTGPSQAHDSESPAMPPPPSRRSDADDLQV